MTGPNESVSPSGLELVIAAEERLLHPETRASPESVLDLLHPDFRELGSSGREWTADAIAAQLHAKAGSMTEPIEMHNAVAIPLGPDAVLLTYTARTEEQSSLRSSVWVRRGERWRLLFHQGTVQPCA